MWEIVLEVGIAMMAGAGTAIGCGWLGYRMGRSSAEDAERKALRELEVRIRADETKLAEERERRRWWEVQREAQKGMQAQHLEEADFRVVPVTPEGEVGIPL